MTFKAEVTRLEKVLNFANGRTSPIRDDNLSIPVYGSNGLIGRASESNSPESTIVIGRVGSYCGSVHFSKESCWVTDNAIKATAKDGNDPFFLYYILKCLNLNNWRSGSGQPLLNQSTLNAIEALIPPYSVQLQISSFLYAIDDRIKLLQDTNSTLESIAQALFKSWFVDFDPVRVKQEGAQLITNDEVDQTLFPNKFELVDLGQVPEGWNFKKMGDISTVGIGKTPPRKEAHWFSENSKDVRWVSIRDMGDYGVYALQTSEFLTPEAVSKFNVRIIPDNTVILSFKMTIGRVSITDGDLTTNEAIAHFKLKDKSQITSEYIYLYLKQFNYLGLSSTSSIADAVNSKTVRDIPILIPTAEVLGAFQDCIKPIFSMLKNYEFQIQTLSSLRDSLVSRLISGQLVMPEIDSEIEAATA